MPVERPTSDEDLLKRYRAGEREAFTLVYRTHQAAVFRFAALMTGDQMKAGDVTQDVFVWLMNHAADFDPARGALGAFLIGVARKILQRRRGEELRWMPLDEISLVAEEAGGCEKVSDDAEALRRAIALLPDKYREIVVLCDIEGDSYEEAAVIVGCAVGTVRSRLHRARGLLARKLEKKTAARSEGRTEKCPV